MPNDDDVGTTTTTNNLISILSIFGQRKVGSSSSTCARILELLERRTWLVRPIELRVPTTYSERVFPGQGSYTSADDNIICPIRNWAALIGEEGDLGKQLPMVTIKIVCKVDSLFSWLKFHKTFGSCFFHLKVYTKLY